MTELKTAAAVVEALGGIERTATVTGARYKAAANWKSFGRFPAKTFVAINTELHRLGLEAPASLWGMSAQASSAAASLGTG